MGDGESSEGAERRRDGAVCLLAAALALLCGCGGRILLSPGGDVRECPRRGGEACVAAARAAGYVEEEEVGAVGIGVAERAVPGRGLRVTRVGPGSPAESAGIAAGDWLVRIRGESPRDRREARMLLFGRAGTRVELQVRKGGRIVPLSVERAPAWRLRGEAERRGADRRGADGSP